jgi:leucyl/phenylalanyl-tRNA--protein transferase
MGYRVKVITADDPPEVFPDPSTISTALGHPDGLIAMGGDLSPQRLIYAYEHGIFPWFNDDQPVLWWSPDPRAVIRVDEFHMSRSLLRELKNNAWSYTVNNCFPAVIDNCAKNRGEHGTWITPEMEHAYNQLHEMGYAHSVESWQDGKLAGGIYGVCLGHIFFGESMFSTAPNGSKVAISALIALARHRGISMIDCQMSSTHLETLGMTEISREQFLLELADNEPLMLDPGDFGKTPESAANLSDLR